MPDAILKHVPGMAQAAEVAARDAATLGKEAFRREFVDNSLPCVIRGAVSHWPAVTRWRDRDYLKTLCRHPVFYWPHENHVTNKRTQAGQQTVAFADAVDLAERDDVAAFGVAMQSDLDADLSGFSFFAPGEPGFLYPAHRMFFFRNAGSTWHYHPFDETLMCQVMEPKRVGLLNARNPLQRHIRRLFYKEDYYENAAAFDGLQTTDLQWFSASLEAGDALYIPPHWWHGVVAASGRLGVTVPMVWRSPDHVIVDCIRRMGEGQVDLLGPFTALQLRNLLAFATKAGVEAEFRAAWQRGLTQRLVSLTG